MSPASDDRNVPGSAGDLPIEWVRLALESLYDNASLAASPLCSRYAAATAATDAIERAQALRSLLLDGIEALRPLQQGQAYAQAARDYEVLSLRYASGLSIEQIAEQLCIGGRQIYRDLRRAEDKLCELLRDRCVATPLSPGIQDQRDALQRELASLQRSQRTLDAREVVAAATAAVRMLAETRSVLLDYVAAPASVLVHATPGVLRATLTELLSGVIQVAAPASTVAIEWRRSGDRPELSITSRLSKSTLRLTQAMDSARAAGFSPTLEPLADGRHCLLLALPTALAKRVLVIEDSDSAFGLYERYLDGTGWQVVRVSDAGNAADAARQMRPGAIVLDIMMPDLDGWTILQSLRLDPDLTNTPIIICSVVYDPGLAAALGASACLAKPVSRPELVAALRQAMER
ncbi:MAG: response regulator [Anaerolineae bacterium]